MRILIIEDDVKISHSITRGLQSEAFAVDIAEDGNQGIFLAQTNDYDTIILDILLPKKNGWEICKELRGSGNLTPILMLTALDSIEDKLQGFHSGVDDYLVKPFHLAELIARVRSLIRRKTEVRSSSIELFGVTLDTNLHKVTRNGQAFPLTSREFAILEFFMMNPQRILSRQEISEHIWDMNFERNSNIIESYIRLLRQKIDKGFDKPLIHTIRGGGYLFSEKP